MFEHVPSSSMTTTVYEQVMHDNVVLTEYEQQLDEVDSAWFEGEYELDDSEDTRLFGPQDYDQQDDDDHFDFESSIAAENDKRQLFVFKVYRYVAILLGLTWVLIFGLVSHYYEENPTIPLLKPQLLGNMVLAAGIAFVINHQTVLFCHWTKYDFTYFWWAGRISSLTAILLSVAYLFGYVHPSYAIPIITIYNHNEVQILVINLIMDTQALLGGRWSSYNSMSCSVAFLYKDLIKIYGYLVFSSCNFIVDDLELL